MIKIMMMMIMMITITHCIFGPALERQTLIGRYTRPHTQFACTRHTHTHAHAPDLVVTSGMIAW